MRNYIFTIKSLMLVVLGFLLFATPALTLAETSAVAQGMSGGIALNWAGYVSDTGTYTTVSGSWVVPTVTNVSASGADATWIGIGGVVTRDLIQAGTEAVPDSAGGIDYQAWYELLPGGSVTVPLTVHAGDSMTASITKESSAGDSSSMSAWLITITDTTSGKSYSTTVNYASSLSSAEWIEEMPAGVGTQISLDNFGTVAFSNGSTTENGSRVSIAGSNAQSLTMANAQAQPLAIPSVLGSDGASFSVMRTAAASSSIGIGGFGQTFISGTTTISPNISVSYGSLGTSYRAHRRYHITRNYSYSTSTGSGVINIVISTMRL